MSALKDLRENNGKEAGEGARTAAAGEKAIPLEVESKKSESQALPGSKRARREGLLSSLQKASQSFTRAGQSLARVGKSLTRETPSLAGEQVKRAAVEATVEANPSEFGIGVDEGADNCLSTTASDGKRIKPNERVRSTSSLGMKNPNGEQLNDKPGAGGCIESEVGCETTLLATEGFGIENDEKFAAISPENSVTMASYSGRSTVLEPSARAAGGAASGVGDRDGIRNKDGDETFPSMLSIRADPSKVAPMASVSATAQYGSREKSRETSPQGVGLLDDKVQGPRVSERNLIHGVHRVHGVHGVHRLHMPQGIALIDHYNLCMTCIECARVTRNPLSSNSHLPKC